jgi:TnpA family transposase
VGDGHAQWADGTHIEIYQNNLFSEHHIRYGKPGGIAYHYVSDKYVVLFTTFIPCSAWEGVYILDLFQSNRSEIQPKTIHADTQGQSATIFGLSYLLGARLMPRIRNWRDLVLSKPNDKEKYHYLGQLFRGTIDWELIRLHWQEMMQIVLSIQAGKLWPSTLLKKLSSYSHKNKLYLAFRELGRVIRTMFILDYLTSTEMQRDIQRMTNKVEGFNQFNEWFVIGSRGVITDNNPDEFDKRMKYRDLMANCVIWQTAVDLTRVVQEMAATGTWKITIEDLEMLSPYITRHYKRFGEFVIELDKAISVRDEDLKLPETIQRAIKSSAVTPIVLTPDDDVEDLRVILDDEEW